jgi:hypothetical protein
MGCWLTRLWASQGRPRAICRLMIWLPMMEEVANSVFLLMAAMVAFMMSEMLPPQQAIVSPTKVCEMGSLSTRTSTVAIVNPQPKCYLYFTIRKM